MHRAEQDVDAPRQPNVSAFWPGPARARVTQQRFGGCGGMTPQNGVPLCRPTLLLRTFGAALRLSICGLPPRSAVDMGCLVFAAHVLMLCSILCRILCYCRLSDKSYFPSHSHPHNSCSFSYSFYCMHDQDQLLFFSSFCFCSVQLCLIARCMARHINVCTPKLPQPQPIFQLVCHNPSHTVIQHNSATQTSIIQSVVYSTVQYFNLTFTVHSSSSTKTVQSCNPCTVCVIPSFSLLSNA